MNRLAPAVLTAAVVLLSGPRAARAELCALDPIPAATLLLPWFEVDLGKFPQLNRAEQTIVSLQNATSFPVLAHVTLWTDLSVPTLAFDVYLTGFDVESINLTELFYTGGIAGLQVADGVRGFVLGTTPSAGLKTLGELIRAHRGQSVGDKCYARSLPGNLARGYLTIDNVNAHSTLFPSEPGYFESGGSGIASNKNSLWGVVLVGSKKSFQADPLVHIEAGNFASGDYTFYGRYVNFDGRDGREPLGRVWAVRYFSGSDQTDVVVWRDSTARQGPFTCSQLGNAGWYPLKHLDAIAFNEIEDAVELFVEGSTVVPGFPAEAQALRAVGPDLDTAPFRSGWIYMNLIDPDTSRSQSYVWVRQGSRKRAALYPGMPFYNHEGGGRPSDVSACGPAPTSTLAAIP